LSCDPQTILQASAIQFSKTRQNFSAAVATGE